MDKNSSQSRMFLNHVFFLRLCHPAGNRYQRPRVIEPYNSMFYSETNSKPKPPKLTRIQGPSPFEHFWNIYKNHQFLRFQTVRFFRGVSQKIISSSIVCCTFTLSGGNRCTRSLYGGLWPVDCVKLKGEWMLLWCHHVIMAMGLLWLSGIVWRIQVFVCHKLWGNHPKIAEVWIAPGFFGSNLIPKFIDPHKEPSIVGQFLWHPWILIFTS